MALSLRKQPDPEPAQDAPRRPEQQLKDFLDQSFADATRSGQAQRDQSLMHLCKGIEIGLATAHAQILIAIEGNYLATKQAIANEVARLSKPVTDILAKAQQEQMQSPEALAAKFSPLTAALDTPKPKPVNVKPMEGNEDVLELTKEVAKAVAPESKGNA